MINQEHIKQKKLKVIKFVRNRAGQIKRTLYFDEQELKIGKGQSQHRYNILLLLGI